MEKFDLTENDWIGITIAKNVARHFLKLKQITPIQIIGLGKALYSLERLPLVTSNSFSQFSVILQEGNEVYSEMRYIEFSIINSSFQISVGGSSYTQGIGSDSFSEPGWVVEAEGFKSSEFELYDLEKTVKDFIESGAEITVCDESEFEVEIEAE